MPSNLLVSFDGHATVLQVRAFEDGVLAEFVLDGNHGVLQGFFLLFFLGHLLPLLPNGIIVGKEVDLLIEMQDGYYAFEIKMAEHVSATDARHLRNLQEFLDKPLLHSFLLSNDNQTHQFGDSITAVHAAYFLG